MHSYEIIWGDYKWALKRTTTLKSGEIKTRILKRQYHHRTDAVNYLRTLRSSK